MAAAGLTAFCRRRSRTRLGISIHIPVVSFAKGSVSRSTASIILKSLSNEFSHGENAMKMIYVPQLEETFEARTVSMCYSIKLLPEAHQRLSSELQYLKNMWLILMFARKVISTLTPIECMYRGVLDLANAVCLCSINITIS